MSGVTISGIWTMVMLLSFLPVSQCPTRPDPDSDYTIFTWRQNSPSSSAQATSATSTTLHVHDPAGQLPEPPAYRNPSFYLFHPSPSMSPRSQSRGSLKDKSLTQKTVVGESRAAKHRKEFERFHSENGVRTIMGTIGPVENGSPHSLAFCQVPARLTRIHISSANAP
jgi:hypothetical protein